MATICSKAPWWINDWGDRVSRRARQGNGDVAKAPLVKDGKVVNMASSIVTTPLIRSGPCSDIKGSSVRATGDMLRRIRVMGSTSTTVSPGWFADSVVSVCKKRNSCGMVLLRRVSRTCSSARAG